MFANLMSLGKNSHSETKSERILKRCVRDRDTTLSFVLKERSPGPQISHLAFSSSWLTQQRSFNALLSVPDTCSQVALEA